MTDVHQNKDGTRTVFFDVFQYDGTRVIVAPPEGRENPSEDYDHYYSYSAKAVLRKNSAADTHYDQLCQYQILTPKEQIKTPIQQPFTPASPEETYLNELNYLNEMKNEITTVSDEATKRVLYEMIWTDEQQEFDWLVQKGFSTPASFILPVSGYSPHLNLKDTNLIQQYQLRKLQDSDYPSYEDFLKSLREKDNTPKKTPEEDASQNQYALPILTQYLQNDEYTKKRKDYQKKVDEWYEKKDFPEDYDAFLKADYSALSYSEYAQKMDTVIDAYDSTIREIIHLYFTHQKDMLFFPADMISEPNK